MKNVFRTVLEGAVTGIISGAVMGLLLLLIGLSESVR